MLKKNKDVSSYTLGIYTCFDKVSKKYRGLFYHYTDAEMIKISLPTILYDYPLRDIEIYKIGKFNEDTSEIISLKPKLISTASYTFPHSRLSCVGDDLSLEEIDKSLKEEKNKIISVLSENKSENKSNNEEK